jgi:sensor histidine kinase YesM
MVMELLINKWLKVNWFRETLFYVFLFAVFTLGDYQNTYGSWRGFSMSLGFYTVLYVHALIYRIWLFPVLFEQKAKGRFMGIAILLLLFFTAITHFLEKTIFRIDQQQLIEEIERLKAEQAAGISTNFASSIVLNIFCIIFMSSIYFIIRYFEQEKKEAKTQLLINQLEINQLRGQLNPHFMFNTLNNLYGVSLEQPERTPDLILKLSQLMRYQIEASRKEYVSLNNEIEFIESYVAIENERVSNRCTLRFEKNIGQNDLKIAPVLLLPFVENAFKHGTTTAEKSFISIKIESPPQSPQKGEMAVSFLSLQIENSIPQKKKSVASTGIGLTNVEQRLSRLYAHRHDLKITENAATFQVHLTLQLND